MPKYEQRLYASKRVLMDYGFTEFRELKVSMALYKIIVADDILASEVMWESIPVTLETRLLDYDFIFDVAKDI